ncbi:MAG: YggS family pyridoxal phosphate-dependent enzyme [Planctomycetota bacterium]
MTSSVAKISENAQRVLERIEQAAADAGRLRSEVQLVAVAKYVDIDTTAALVQSGLDLLGESRPQQLWQKAASPALESIRWHMIGHLQRNKVQRTVPLVDLIHSVDSERLLRSIDRAASEHGKKQRVLLEVNTSGDAAKHGLSSVELQKLLPTLTDFSSVEVCGLMTMAAREGGTAVASRNFAALRELRDVVQRECPDGIKLTELSMGMSHDFETAIREGATLVRIGSLLFQGVL